ncbi:MAG: ThiF family adenylyltransferase [Desulfobacterales bacterium]|jgi:adenylyltransferase/sulfurtransferase|nr:ThiF family adenylyltransferase [Desulfobacterales bacterium]
MPTSEGQKRYARRIMLPAIGVEGQAIISRSRVAVVGCGGLGPVLSQIMVGMGARRVTVIDNDRPDITNLHRQIVHDETDVRAGHMKALVAADKLGRINSQANTVGVAEFLDAVNADRLWPAAPWCCTTRTTCARGGC